MRALREVFAPEGRAEGWMGCDESKGFSSWPQLQAWWPGWGSLAYPGGLWIPRPGFKGRREPTRFRRFSVPALPTGSTRAGFFPTNVGPGRSRGPFQRGENFG